MIHWHKEGQYFKPGLNIEITYYHVHWVWIKVNLDSGECTGKRFRWSWWNPILKHFRWMWQSDTAYPWNIIDSWLFDHDCVVITRADWEDEIKSPKRMR